LLETARAQPVRKCPARLLVTRNDDYTARMSTVSLAIEDVSADITAVIGDGLRGYNRDHGHNLDRSEFTVTVRDDAHQMVGGLVAVAGAGVLFIQWVFLPPDRRLEGVGRQVMALAEAEGLRRGCRLAHLDTFTFQARAFYEKLGYSVFGTLDYPDPQVSRYYMRKTLI